MPATDVIISMNTVRPVLQDMLSLTESFWAGTESGDRGCHAGTQIGKTLEELIDFRGKNPLKVFHITISSLNPLIRN